MMPVQSLFDRFCRDQRGGPLVEIAILFPFMLLLIFGSMETGSVIYQQHVLTKGVQEAARYAARSSALSESNACPTASAGWPAAVTQAKNLATRGRATDGVPLILPNFTADKISISISCVPMGTFVSPNPASGQIPIVVASASITASSPGFLGLLNMAAFTLTASHQELGIGL